MQSLELQVLYCIPRMLDVIRLAGTPYAGGAFRVKLALGKDFPATPPKAYFLTKIFHPNVAPNGEICVNTLKRDWKPDLGIKHILLVSEQNVDVLFVSWKPNWALGLFLCLIN